MIEWKSHDSLLPSDKSFGIFSAIIGLIASLYFYFVGSFFASTLSASTSILVLVAVLIKPSVLRALNVGWLYLGLFLGAIISPIVLGGIYFFVITPVAIILRILGRDELRLELKNSGSDWRVRNDYIINFDKQY